MRGVGRGVGTQIMKKTTIHSASLWCAILIFAVLAAYLTLRSISLYGPGLSPDSTGYIRLARDITENGFRFLTEKKAISQPPAYPLALAAISRFAGTSVLTAATWINAIASATLVALILLSVARITRSPSLYVIAGILSCFSIPLTHVWSMAWTEPMFILLISLTFLAVTHTKRTAISVVASAVLTAAALLTRYAGIVLIPVVCAFLFFSGAGTFWRRCKYPLLYALPPTLILALYSGRNYALSGTPLGARSPSQMGLADNIYLATNVIFGWFLPWRIRSFETLLLTGCVLIGAMVWRHRHHIARVIRQSDRIVLLSGLFFVVYTAFIVWTSTTTAYDRIDNRLLSPLYPSVVIMFAFLLKPESWRSQLIRVPALGVFCLLCVVAPLRATYSQVNRSAEQGAGGYNSRAWQESEVVSYFRDNGQPKDKIVFSNAPDALYILADVTAKKSPAARHYNSDSTTGVTEGNLFAKHPLLDDALLVWLDKKPRNYLFTPDELQMMCDLTVIHQFSDGTIYRVESSNKHIESDK